MRVNIMRGRLKRETAGDADEGGGGAELTENIAADKPE